MLGRTASKSARFCSLEAMAHVVGRDSFWVFRQLAGLQDLSQTALMDWSRP